MNKASTKTKQLILSKNLLINLESNQDKTLEILVDKDSEIDINLVLYAKNEDSYKLNYKIIHKYPRTKSRSSFKVVLDDEASFDFQGLIKVLNGASNSDAYLKVEVLTISENATAHVVPSLEIEENEIKASHGATITKINEDQIFYMMSRGLDRKESKNEIVKGFLN